MTTNMVIAKQNNKELLATVDTLNDIVSFAIISISLIIAAVPEGLPLAVTIALAFSVMQMKKDNNLVRKLEASETMGGANEICTDKTGTLTINQMTVQQFFTKGKIYDAVPSGELRKLDTADILAESVLFNCSARIEQEKGETVVRGNSTEKGLIGFLID